MLETYAWNLVSCVDILATIRADLRAAIHAAQVEHNAPQAEATNFDRTRFDSMFNDLQPWLKEHMLTGTINHLKRTREEMNGGDPERIVLMLDMGSLILEDELRERTFLYIHPEDANLFSNSPASFALTYGRYPNARYDIQEAGKC